MNRFLCAAALLAVGCATAFVNFDAPDRDRESESYETNLRRWTRSGKAIVRFDTEIEVRATLKGWDFRQAYLAQLAERYGLSARELGERRAAEAKAARETTEFVAVVYTPDVRKNDLDNVSSAWRVTLHALPGGVPVAPRRIASVGRDPVFEAFFPFHSAFSKTYIITFERPTVAYRDLTLRVGGPSGAATLTWSSRKD